MRHAAKERPIERRARGVTGAASRRRHDTSTSHRARVTYSVAMTVIETETATSGAYPQVVRIRSHTLSADVGPDLGGDDTAPGAHDYFDAALAICKAHTALWYAKRKGIPLERVDTRVES